MATERPDPEGLDARVALLNEAVRTKQAVPAGRLFGLPELPGDGCWVDIAGAAVLTEVSPKTITGWLARRGPTRNPFPLPHRILYRLYWPRTDIESWRSMERLPLKDSKLGVPLLGGRGRRAGR